MMRPDRFAWGFAMLVLAASATLTVHSLPSGADQPWRVPPSASDDDPAPDAKGEVVQQVVGGDPFRLARRPAEVPFGVAMTPVPPPTATREPAPRVTGIVGPPWRAVLEGISGYEGARLVARGDSIGKWRVRDVLHDVVVVQGADTTWRLTVRKP